MQSWILERDQNSKEERLKVVKEKAKIGEKITVTEKR